ncbi:hypothetical protein [Streptomyces californicus]|uniref:hypothetical protein n=1 Tax=Streptomyces californicus TaxID=67351 RepID=UPI0036F6AADC
MATKPASRRKRKPAASTKPRAGRAKAPATPASIPTQAAAPEITVPAVCPEADPILADAADRAADLRDQAAADVARILADGEARAADLLESAGTKAASITEAAASEQSRLLAAAQADADQIRTAAAHAAAADADQVRADADATAEQLLADARRQADTVTATVTGEADQALADARAASEQLLDDARRQADEVRTEAKQAAAQALAAAETARTELLAAAERTATETRTRAGTDAEQVLERARGEADQMRESAHDQATQVRAEAEKAAAALTTRAESDAARLRERAEAEASQLREDAGRDEEEARRSAARVRKLAEEDIARLKSTAAEDAERLTRNARGEAERIVAAARTRSEADRAGAEKALADARLREADTEVTLKAAHDKAAEADERMRRALDRTERRIERKRLKSEARQERDEARDTRRARVRELRAAARAGKPTRTERVKKFVLVNAERLLVILPITAPMAVAWTGQAGFAGDILGWEAPWTVLFAAAFELSTAFVGWMYHQARKDGDAGTLYRIATWIFAMGAAVMNFWHASGLPKEGTRVWDETARRFIQEITYWHFTPKAVAFATMSIVGMALWELYATLLHRRKLRDDGKVANARPSIGIVRWARYPRHAFTAWSLAITDASLTTLNHAWHAAERELTHRRTLRSARSGSPLPATYRVLPLNGSPNPGQVPDFFVNLTRTDLPNQTNREPGLNRPALPAPANLNHPDANLRFGGGEPALPPGAARTGDDPGGKRDANQRTANREPDRDRGANLASRSQQQAEQVEKVLNLIDELGYDTVKLRVVQERTGMTKTTAYHRLNDARDAYNRRQAG